MYFLGLVLNKTLHILLGRFSSTYTFKRSICLLVPESSIGTENQLYDKYHMCIGIRNSVWINICCAEMCLVEYVQRDKKKILGKNHDESSMQEKYKKEKRLCDNEFGMFRYLLTHYQGISVSDCNKFCVILISITVL